MNSVSKYFVLFFVLFILHTQKPLYAESESSPYALDLGKVVVTTSRLEQRYKKSSFS